jgi:NitT/TauT family transport system substrate-binding protein
MSDPEAAIDAVVDQNASLAYARDIERRKLDWVIEAFVDVEGFADCWGRHDPERWSNLVERMTAADMLDGPVDADDLWTNAYLDAEASVLGGFAERVRAD